VPPPLLCRRHRCAASATADAKRAPPSPFCRLCRRRCVAATAPPPQGQEDIETTCEVLAERMGTLDEPPPLLLLPMYSQLPADLQVSASAAPVCVDVAVEHTPRQEDVVAHGRWRARRACAVTTATADAPVA
jgi:hypothetical protein